VANLGDDIEAHGPYFREAFSAVFDLVKPDGLFSGGDKAVELKLSDCYGGSLALNESVSLNTSNNSKNGGEYAYNARPPQQATFKVFGLFPFFILIASAWLGVWSIVFWDGLGHWRWVVSLLGWSVMVATFVFLHDLTSLNILQSDHFRTNCNEGRQHERC